MSEQLYRIDPEYDTIENATGRLASDCVMTGVLVPVEVDYEAATIEWAAQRMEPDIFVTIRDLAARIVDAALGIGGDDE